ncbi:hypothetical protein A0H81_02406 [Grifola frondosa]|uniref:Uncharacterized protein n=1 Tax=Grifola frondosa TaxID=5627 RepID=A0A1C7MMB2_GRIFR|nr:hypothetical protein A0H81_02406 [Grifola frondosa]
MRLDVFSNCLHRQIFKPQNNPALENQDARVALRSSIPVPNTQRSCQRTYYDYVQKKQQHCEPQDKIQNAHENFVTTGSGLLIGQQFMIEHCWETLLILALAKVNVCVDRLVMDAFIGAK